MTVGGLERLVAIVTGSSHGIGRAIAESYASHGARVVVNFSRSEKEADATVAHIVGQGGEAIAVRADVSNADDVERLVRETVDAFGGIDVLVNNAGIAIDKPFLDLTEDDWDRVFAVNVKGTFLCTRAAVRWMRERGGGRIINLSSIAARVGDYETSVYCASKGAIEALTIQLALELGPWGINVNAIGPGTIATPLNADFLSDPAKVESIVAATPLGRLGRPEDVAGAAIFLASSSAAFITGVTIYVDGGWLTH